MWLGSFVQPTTSPHTAILVCLLYMEGSPLGGETGLPDNYHMFAGWMSEEMNGPMLWR